MTKYKLFLIKSRSDKEATMRLPRASKWYAIGSMTARPTLQTLSSMLYASKTIATPNRLSKPYKIIKITQSNYGRLSTNKTQRNIPDCIR